LTAHFTASDVFQVSFRHLRRLPACHVLLSVMDTVLGMWPRNNQLLIIRMLPGSSALDLGEGQ